MELAASILFYLHTTLCVGYALYVLTNLATAMPGGASVVDWRDLDGLEEWFVHASGWAILGLYLMFTEVYLYRMHLGI